MFICFVLRSILCNFATKYNYLEPMKRFLMMALVVLTSCSLAWSIPARPGKVKVTQPDGTQLTIELHGDEYRHFTTTADGYTVVKAADGFYYYAVKNLTELLPSQFIARDAEHRTAAENLFLSTTKKRIMADMTAEQKEFQQRGRSLWGKPMLKAPANAPAKARYDYSKFKGLIVLIEWSDRSFARENTKELFEQMVNQAGYTGYQDDLLNQYVSCTGSVTDYFSDNSEQIFQPQFDIVGPVKVNYTCTYPNGGKNLYPVINSAFQQLDPDVNFADYDVDKDGRVDMVYFIFAGYASSSEGNDSRYVWPHASTLAYYSSLRYDNKRFGRYACSTEFDGFEAYDQVDLCGIGTICHEFSHVLGLADHYDADYEDGGGQSYDPGAWDIMAGGCNNNKSRTPAGYNAYEKFTLGFMSAPEVLDMEGQNYSLEALNTSNKAYRINSKQNKEFFLIENRQKTRWDAALPGHGMLVWRVDSTDVSIWNANEVNNFPDHNYFELVRATPSGGDSQGDPYPGSGKVEDLTNDTEPGSLLTWAGYRSDITLTKIKESDGTIYFRTAGPDELALLETFELIGVGTGNTNGVEGVFCNWDMDKVEIVPTQDTFGMENQMLAMNRSGIITSSAIDSPIRYVTFKAWNSSKKQVQITFSVMNPGETKWTTVKEVTSNTNSLKLDKNEIANLRYILNSKAGTKFRFQYLSTVNNTVCYVDNIKVVLEDPSSIATGIVDVNQEIPTDERCYNLNGQRVSPDTKGIIIRNGKKYLNK